MKHQLLFRYILALILLSGTAANAQRALPARRTGGVAPRPRPSGTGATLKDGLTMQKGRVVLTELGITSLLTADKKLINGTTISTTGLVTATDGTTTQMMEGDMVSLTGRVTTRTSKVEADSLLKIKLFDAKYPGKRKKMEAEKERKEKAKAKMEEKRAKAKRK
ncbi:MAG: hypothetical protein JWR44_3125 [Hymenobacter sp.]|jgi:hypothetical protein|nr:hypothetical protein [Hymenobacter sp.]